MTLDLFRIIGIAHLQLAVMIVKEIDFYMNLSQPFVLVSKLQSRLFVKDILHWSSNTSRQKAFKAHKDTETIFLRFRQELISNKSNQLRLVDYPLLSIYKEEIKAYLNELSEFYCFKDFSVIIANLKSHGGTIRMHIDRGPYFQSSHRIHIPIKTNDSTAFHIGDVSVNMKENIAYEIGNTNHPHGVVNNGDTDRYHLIFDLFPTAVGSSKIS
jgi:hypothetical protein